MQRLQLDKSIFEEDRMVARLNREYFALHGITAVNLIGSPGCGKTTLLEHALPRLTRPTAVITGDIEGSFDAERLEQVGIRASQINTHGACHLSALLVHQALETTELTHGTLLVIENVGNLVCPAAVDLGEAFTVAVLSAAEGHEKPTKYPLLFQRAAITVITKADLALAAFFDIGRAAEAIRQQNPEADILPLSAVTGEGMEALLKRLAELACAL